MRVFTHHFVVRHRLSQVLSLTERPTQWPLRTVHASASKQRRRYVSVVHRCCHRLAKIETKNKYEIHLESIWAKRRRFGNMYRYLSLETDQGKTDTRTNAPERKATSSKSGSAISIRSRRHTLLPLWPPPTIDTLNGPLRWLPANIRPFVREEKFFPFHFVGKIDPGNSRLISPTNWFQFFSPFSHFSLAVTLFLFDFQRRECSICRWGYSLHADFYFRCAFCSVTLAVAAQHRVNVYFCYFTAVPSGIFRPIAVVPNSQCKFHSFFRSLAFLYWL